ncbi:unnamed protein product [Rotaria sp. Silwood1]|nr:unnamed protein product [Rotaria sp. Silwood1]CAF1597821.1 unnamed protein product [Rotaria sp. Silwood1]CAF3771766.1 unnamed protein product [Rotaria sp. Silwood1]CAF4649206.1 unnamed protein product [Rotaria sp. Silwood1]
MLGCGFPSFSLPLCSQSMMSPCNMSMGQASANPFSLAQPCLQNFVQPGSMMVPCAAQPAMVPTAVPVPMPVAIERPCAIPFLQPVPVPVERPCAVPVPVPVVPAMDGCQVHQCQTYTECRKCPSYRQVEYIIEEPVYIRRCRRRRYRCRSYCCSQTPLAPIIIPIQAPAVVAQQPPLQVKEYVQEIYPPAQVYTEQVPVGYAIQNVAIQQPNIIQN